MAWRPKKTASAQAVRLRVIRSGGCSARFSADRPSSGRGAYGAVEAYAFRFRTKGIHGSTASAGRTAQTARPGCQ